MWLNWVEFIIDLEISALGSQASIGFENKIEQLNTRTQSHKLGFPMYLYTGKGYNKCTGSTISSQCEAGTSWI